MQHVIRCEKVTRTSHAETCNPYDKYDYFSLNLMRNIITHMCIIEDLIMLDINHICSTRIPTNN